MEEKKFDKFSFKELVKEAKLIAMSDRTKVMKKSTRFIKAPHINWEKNPGDYTGYQDKRYPTSIVCNWIPSLKLQLVVIDLDIPKKEGDIPIEVLQSVNMKLIERTRTVKTPSGGLHIYLLSKQKPIEKQPKINIDYQTNTRKEEKGKGKYVIADYRWNRKGEKEPYTKLVQSPEDILIVESSDQILNLLLNDLTNKGVIKSPKEKYQENIVELLRKYAQRGVRHDLALAISGYLRKEGYPITMVEGIIKNVFKGDEELNDRLLALKQTYEKDMNDVTGYTRLKEELLSPADLSTLEELVRSTKGTLKSKIFKTLNKNKEPSAKELADYINKELELYKNRDTKKYYEKTQEGEIREIDEKRIEEKLNEDFGYNNIPTKKAWAVLDHVTRPIIKNYDLIEFENGILNTKTKSFDTDKSEYEETPKLVLDLKWNPEATPGRIKEILDRILDNDKYPRDKELFLRSVGHAFMGVNRLGKYTIMEGQSRTGKSTLTTLLKRIFNYSEVPTRNIVEGKDFALYNLVDKDINIDDDINNGVLRGIGNLNRLVSGEGFELQVKYEKFFIDCNNEQTPRFFANGNTLPPVIGEGFITRLLLIHTRNIIPDKEDDQYLHTDILHGKYDTDGMEWFIHTALNTYWDHHDEPLFDEKEKEKMERDWNFKSDPVKIAIQEIFENDYGGEHGFNNIAVSTVNMYVKAWILKAYGMGVISREHRKPSIKQISDAMNEEGYEKGRNTYSDGYDRKTIREYEDIRIKKGTTLSLKKYIKMLGGEISEDEEKLL